MTIPTTKSIHIEMICKIVYLKVVINNTNIAVEHIRSIMTL
ncbi:hypothetical protein JZO67_002812 [Enterococcus sp. 665A]|uniref:Uncharacterized protein n=1 Tax=Candidatus Enterococcus ferrettii TaxID=2815324 RepID=A0ABV0ETK1_9ENTE